MSDRTLRRVLRAAIAVCGFLAAICVYCLLTAWAFAWAVQYRTAGQYLAATVVALLPIFAPAAVGVAILAYLDD